MQRLQNKTEIKGLLSASSLRVRTRFVCIHSLVDVATSLARPTVFMHSSVVNRRLKEAVQINEGCSSDFARTNNKELELCDIATG